MEKMKILLINGCIEQNELKDAVCEVLQQRGLDVMCVDLDHAVAGCITCGKCIRKRYCVLDEELGRNVLYEGVIGVMILCRVQYERPDRNLVSYLKRMMYSRCERFDRMPYAIVYVSRNMQEKPSMEIDDLMARGNMFKVQDQHNGVIHSKQDILDVKKMADRLGWISQCTENGRKDLPECEGPVVMKDFVR